MYRNRAKGDAESGTGVCPAIWQYPPHVLRTLTEVSIPPEVTSIEKWAFQGCSALARVSIPASVTGIGEVAFYKAGLQEVCYGGTEAQWKAIQMGGYNEKLNQTSIHCGHLLADVRTTDYTLPGPWRGPWKTASPPAPETNAFSPAPTVPRPRYSPSFGGPRAVPSPPAVSGSEHYAEDMEWAVEQKITGRGLVPAAPCTRAAAVTYLWRAAGSPEVRVASFQDIPSGAGFADAVNWAVENGVTSGTSADTFFPNSACTRGQIVTFLYRALGK